MPAWAGSKFALSTYLAARVRRMIAERDHWHVLPRDVQEWLEVQDARSHIPSTSEMLLETFQRGRRCYLVAYPFDGRISHGTLCQLLTRRLERLGKRPLGFVANDYALAIWAMKPMDDLDFDALFQEDMLGDDLESWLDESFMMKRTFRHCAILSGLIERRLPGKEKSGRQVTFSTDLIYDALRRHQPDHLLLQCAREDAATGLLDVARLARLLQPNGAPDPDARVALRRARAAGDRARDGRQRRGRPDGGVRRDADRRGHAARPGGRLAWGRLTALTLRP